jgi:hypothetical protein
MLRITISKNLNGTTLRVEGKLVGPWVDELERTWRGLAALPGDAAVAVDLTDITFVSEEGKRLLQTMYGEGAKLKASGCVTRRLTEEIEQSFSRAHSKQGVLSPK